MSHQLRYTPREFAQKMKLSEEYIRQCCRASQGGSKTRGKLPAGWKAMRDARARRWYIISELLETDDSLIHEHEIVSDKILQLWRDMWTQESLVWNFDPRSKERYMRYARLVEPPLFFSDLGKAHLAVRESKSVLGSINLKLTFDWHGGWQIELLPPWNEPLLFDLYKYGGWFRQLLRIWQCCFGKAPEINGVRYRPYSGNTKDFDQFLDFERCLNCGLPFKRKGRRKLYCDDDCRVGFQRWFYRANKLPDNKQAESVCKRLVLVARKHGSWRSSVNARRQVVNRV